MLIKFWGVHGSLPRPGPSTLKYGGNTACVEVRCSDTLIILDAGTGIREFGETLVRRGKDAQDERADISGHIFFSHLHWDHVQGFPFFDPIYQRGNAFHLYGGGGLDDTVRRIMSTQMCEPNFPVKLDCLPAALEFHEVTNGDRIRVGEVDVRVKRLNHPGGSFGYRLDEGGKVLVYATDTEHVTGIDPDALDLARDADVLIYDSMYAPEQYLGLWDNIPRRSWGHSTWEGAVELANAANVKRLVLFHHGNEDRVVEDIEKQAQDKLPSVIAAYEGLEIEL
jgi:phosphoribosyl 1,2-cyclic phosphodiesterase